MIGAIDGFTPENGGTVLYRGSHNWSSERIQAVREAVARGDTSVEAACRLQLALRAGAICVFEGTLLHGGGANATGTPRLAFTNQYCEPWARPQENFFLGVPRERVRVMSRETQILLGYELLPPGSIMGRVSGYHPVKTLDAGPALTQHAPGLETRPNVISWFDIEDPDGDRKAYREKTRCAASDHSSDRRRDM